MAGEWWRIVRRSGRDYCNPAGPRSRPQLHQQPRGQDTPGEGMKGMSRIPDNHVRAILNDHEQFS